MAIYKKSVFWGFSLIELLVVIAIVGILAATAVPAYQQYSSRAKITSVVAAANSIVKDLQKYYDTKGSWPSSINVKGITVPNTGSNAVVNLGNLHTIQYAYHANAPRSVFLALSVSGLQNISGYVDPAVGSAQGSIIVFATRAETNGTYTTKCGQYATDNNFSLPLAYLPSACQCNNVWNWWFNNASSCNT